MKYFLNSLQATFKFYNVIFYIFKKSLTAVISVGSDADFSAAVVVSFGAPVARVSDILILRPHHFGDQVFGDAVDALFVVLVDHAVGHALEPIVLKKNTFDRFWKFSFMPSTNATGSQEIERSFLRV